jgi:hypothetical protein
MSKTREIFVSEQGGSGCRRAGSPSQPEQRSAEPKVPRLEQVAPLVPHAAFLLAGQGIQPSHRQERLAWDARVSQSCFMGG